MPRLLENNSTDLFLKLEADEDDREKIDLCLVNSQNVVIRRIGHFTQIGLILYDVVPTDALRRAGFICPLNTETRLHVELIGGHTLGTRDDF